MISVRRSLRTLLAIYLTIIIIASLYLLIIPGLEYNNAIDNIEEHMYEEAFGLFIRSARKGNLQSQYRVGMMFFNGVGTPTNFEEAVYWLGRAANRDHASAQNAFAINIFYGNGTEQSYAQAHEWFSRATQNGNINSLYYLGRINFFGLGIERNEATGINYFEQASQAGNAQAQFQLGLCHFYGQGIARNYSRAFSLFSQAADQGHLDALFMMGVCLEHGYGTEANAVQAVLWYRRAVELGHIAAHYNLGRSYFFGNGVDVDYNRAYSLLNIAINEGHNESRRFLAYLYIDGLGVAKNEERALQLFFNKSFADAPTRNYHLGLIHQQASDDIRENDGQGRNNRADQWISNAFVFFRQSAVGGHDNAQYILGTSYAEGYVLRQSYEDAAHWLSRAAEQNHAPAQNSLGDLYFAGLGVEQSYQRATLWHRRASDAGFASGQFNLGNAYLHGHGVNVNHTQASTLFALAAEQGLAPAQVALGESYYSGTGVSINHGEAANWFRSAAEQDYADGQFLYGHMYLYGRGVPQNYDAAFIWFMKAAEQNNYRAQNALGEMFHYGHGIEVDYAESYNWFVKSANQEYSTAQRNLGLSFYYGRGVALDFEQALFWLRKAAEQGDATAPFFIGICYEYGRGVPRDKEQATHWYNIAIARGFTIPIPIPETPIITVTETMYGKTVSFASSVDSMIFYTLDGTTPDRSSNEGISIDLHTAGTYVISVRSINDGIWFELMGWRGLWGDPITETIIVEKVGNPAPSVEEGVVEAYTMLVLTSHPADAMIFYTTDGTEPTQDSRLFATGIRIDDTVTITARAFRPGMEISDIVILEYAVPPRNPVISVSNIVDGRRVEFSTTTTDARIHFTTNGTMPTLTSPQGTSHTLRTAGTFEVMARAYRDGLWSDLITQTVTIQKENVPTASPAPGTVIPGTSVTLTSAPGTTIRFTTNGTDPTATSPIYTAPIPLTATRTNIRARVFRDGSEPSDVASFNYIIPPATPQISIANVINGRVASFSTATAGARIFFTLDGSTPTETSLSGTTTNLFEARAYSIRVAAIHDGVWSAVASYNVTVPQASVPTSNRPSGNVTTGTTVTLSAGNNAAIRFTLDGTEPTANSTLFTTPLTLSATITTIRARAFVEGSVPSTVAEFTYIIPPATPTITTTDVPHGQTVTFATATPGARIFFTLDGSTPNENSLTGVSHNLLEARTYSVRARAIIDGVWGETASSNITVSRLRNPTSNRASGNVSRGTTITLSAESNANIFFTTDGTVPTERSTRFITPIELTATTTTIRARAFRAGNVPSEIVEFTYIIPPATPTITTSDAPHGKTVTFSTATPGARIFFTLDGTIPNESSLTGISHNLLEARMYNIRARAIIDGVWSETASSNVTVSRLRNPSSNRASGNVARGTTITLSGESNANIFFTTDGTVPTEQSTRFTTPIELTATSTTIRARAFRAGNVPSEIVEFTFIIPPVRPTLTASNLPHGQRIQFITETTNALIFYTLDGSTPTESSNVGIFVHQRDLLVAGTYNIRARAWINGVWSDTTSLNVTVARLTDPRSNRASGNVTAGTTITLSAQANTRIFYTLDGTEPTEWSRLYTGPIPLTATTTTIRAKAFREGSVPSGVAIFTYTIPPARPTITTSNAPRGQIVTFATATPGARVFFTLDGSTPTETSFTGFSHELLEARAYQIRARAMIDGVWSDTASSNITVQRTTAPTASPRAGNVNPGTNVTLSAHAQATIFFTLDGTDPTEWSTRYTGPIALIGTTTTIRARAFRDGFVPSDVAVFTYTIPPVRPAISVLNASFGRTLTLSTATPGATIFYTLDGSTPTEFSQSGTFFEIRNAGTFNIRARALFNGVWSDLASSNITVQRAANPSSNRASGVVPAGTTVTLTSSGATSIRFTTDGSMPTEWSPIYTGPIAITHDMTIRAVAFRDGFAASDVMTFMYTVPLSP